MKTIYTNAKIKDVKVKPTKRYLVEQEKHGSRWSSICQYCLRIIIAVVGGLGVITLFHFLFLSPYFNLHAVEVSRLTHIEKEEILNLTNLRPLSNLLTLRTGKIAVRIAEHPWVEQVRIKKHLPDKLYFEIIEREPVAIVSVNPALGVDSSGYLLPGIRMETVQDIPLITVREKVLAEHPRRIISPEMRNALFVIQYLKLNEPALLKEISELNIEDPDNVVLYSLHEGTEIRLGNENFEERLAKLHQVWQLVRQQQLVEEYIDLRFDKQGVVTKPKVIKIRNPIIPGKINPDTSIEKI